jgi:hypothetical protein
MSLNATPQIISRQTRQSSPRARWGAIALVALALAACSSDEQTADQHSVYFVGYVYDGASGARLMPAQITAISLKYRDKVIRTQIEADGRFVTLDPLPTWQDYAVYIGAPGYRPFVSRNRGIDVPASLSMTDKLGSTATTQTFQFDATLFPASLKSPPVVVTIEKSDAAVAPMPLPRATGTIRLRPESSSVLERSGGDGAVPGVTTGTGARRWFNDEDLLSQTITRAFTEGRVEIAEGELAYGVPYQIAIFDVKGYQPMVLSGSMSLLAGAVTSRSVTLPKELRDPLRILSTTAEACAPPAGTLNDYGAAIQVTFNETVEFVGPSWAEDFDNGVQVQPSASTSSLYCPLKTSTDPTKQERGTRVTLEGNVLTLAFNPTAGFSSTSPYGSSCMVPPQISAVVYGNLQLISLQAKGDPTRKRTLDAMLNELAGTSGSGLPGSLSCPGRARVGF